jgi:membrane peptidoglycan carboxypeptidase
MTLTTHPVKFTRIALSLFLLISLLSGASLARTKRSALAKKSAAADKRSRRDQERKRSAREARAERGRERKLSPRERRAAEREAAREVSRKGGRPLSRRERLMEARRLAEQRRREAIEAARRAELARLAAIARQRAADQALRDETAANILKDDTTGEDLEVRRAAVNALGNYAGSVVVMDPKTGRIYTVVNQEWGVRRGFKPCSTVKLVTGLAGLSEQVIPPVQTINVSGTNYDIGLTDALAFSENSYFQSVGGRVGFDHMTTYARELGLGQPTGINHANEYAGRIPAFKSGWAVNHMSSHGDDFEVTPVQLANLASVIANGGNLLVPHLPRTPDENFNFKTEVRRKVNVPQDALHRIVPGMIGAATYGTGKLSYDPYMQVAGKTGTCIGQGSWLGLYTSYAPVADPHLAVAVVIRGSGSRGRIAAGIAGRVYRALDARFAKTVNGQLIATTPKVPTPRPQLDPKTAAKISDESENEAASDAAAAGAAGAGATNAAVGAAQQSTQSNQSNNGVKSVIMTVPKTLPIRKTEVTMQPAAPANSNSTTTTAPTKSSDQQQRPRRVLANTP